MSRVALRSVLALINQLLPAVKLVNFSSTLRSKIFVAKKTNAKILVRKFSSNGHDLIRHENFRQNIKVIKINFCYDTTYILSKNC